MKKNIIVLALAIMGLSNANAQTAQPETKKPGDVSLPSSKGALEKLASFDNGNYKYSVEDFYTKPKARAFRLSPDGLRMSYFQKMDNGKTNVYVKEIKTGKVSLVIEEKEELIKTYFWLNNERLVYVMDKGGNENIHVYSAGIDGSAPIDLTPFEGVQAEINTVLKNQRDFIIVTMNKENKQVKEPYKINIKTGAIERLYTNTDLKNPILAYNFDKDGNLIGFTRLVNGINMQYYYRPAGASDFKLLKEFESTETFSVVSLNYQTPNPDDAYVISNLESDKTQIVLYDLKQNKMIKEIYSNPTFDSNYLWLSENRNFEVDYVGFNGEKNTIIPISKPFKKIYDNIQKEFKDAQFSIVSQSDDEEKMLIIVSSDKFYGKYYQYDSKLDKMTYMFDLMPKLEQKDMSVMKPISFKSRDGILIHGYITLPKEALDGKKVPLIVNPHGGPQTVRDSWGFNQEAQLFASRGYATLHVNFRISGGYGKEFLKAGYGQIGRKVMDDLEDGVQYVLSQGWINKDKIAIYGASHGGYATLMGLVKTPDLYACGVDYVGISNIETFFSSFPEYWKPYKEAGKKIWYDLDNPAEAKIAKEVSPFYHVDKIKKPLFVVQGANDPRVNIAESDQIVTALRKKGFDVPYMVKYNEGHGFGREENQIELYKSMLGFFAQYLKK
ncbi:dipeptidyl aminopeptidase/acylaminoacyl peptidase [Flavobacterium tiangeerense]|uniref:Dipeptidyl aminopeptidase/acylaminoacyl peptidase n=1 Tax=Flavobacterium tiangeerense TaxID=459471 RepID=A0ABY3FMJ8_9FLAO|nr:S9 family peptidase [Flavobacterium tiangeerense]TWI02246.1 dipeptidyl aminopeptidase/acylaminoacyl peptidase [Flavobacterium tiangeerense]